MKERVRAALLEGDNLVVFRRQRPGVPVYWALPGGGVEPEDADLVAALRRELDEEMKAEIGEPVLLTSRETPYADGKSPLQHLFAARLISLDFAKRHGPEFSDPSKGEYAVERIPLTKEALTDCRLFPPELADYLREHVDEVSRIL
ncbi:8-oxo-dGTP pyrophosphatase MutT (NUDIX family) [Hamadaea flava]|uniref:NUDIX domain-containing protein n=1 Tax=Hamadaea flava TaxID=1742688 RepID=A0ABV8LK36_9ACTN|nr:NUDIX hydrolase [Hamadaea flava]MCP2323796.1 8-oxo-dGTP pyrophosphatase MutT (NUDIX family) [Hamadaea flava]